MGAHSPFCSRKQTLTILAQDPEDQHKVLKMIQYFNFRGHFCIATELLSINLYELIKANGFVGFSTLLVRRFANQMLLALSLMRHHRIVHCDLKPENVLLKHPAKSALKVIDFGSSCFEHEKSTSERPSPIAGTDTAS
jgi:dual specificity tyrosine-phosphorylation-regulated kinase 2/3/4